MNATVWDAYTKPPATKGAKTERPKWWRGDADVIYAYPDASGTILYEVLRRGSGAEKDFKHCVPDATKRGGYRYTLGDVERVLYRLPELQAADPAEPVFFCEGEKDVDRLRSLGLVATTCAQGGNPWQSPAYEDPLRGRTVIALQDHDEAGRTFATKVANHLYGKAGWVGILALPGLAEKGDISDWLDAGGTKDELLRLAYAVSPFAPLPNSANGANGDKPVSAGFRLTRLTDLLAEDAEEIDWAVDDLLPAGGISILGAKPKVGKSTTARTLAFVQSRGESFLGRPTHKGPVVYLALEEKRSEVAKHFHRMGATDEPIFVHVGAAPEEALAALTAAIAEHKPVLAIVDPLLKLIRLRDANDYAEVSRSMEPLIELARLTKCHILCVHHLGKGERTGGDAILGSTALFGAVDTAILMRRRNDQRVIESVQRYGTDFPETVVNLDLDTGIVVAAGEVAVIEQHEMGKKILEAISDEELTETQIVERIGGNPTKVAKAIRALIDEEKLDRTGKGKKGDPYIYFKSAAQETPKAPSSPSPQEIHLENGANGVNGESGEEILTCMHCGENPLPRGADKYAKCADCKERIAA